jgi:hypothetical protein
LTRRESQVRGPRAATDPYGLAAVGTYGGPVAAAGGLLVAAWLTVGLLTGNFAVPGASGNNGGNGGPIKTATPSNQVIVPPAETIPGEIVYAKDGNIWIQSGEGAHQLTSGGSDSMPSWSPDGQYIYYIHTVDEYGMFPDPVKPRRYAMTIPNVMRIKADGSGKPVKITTGKYRSGPYTWFYWIRQPVLSPNGRTLALLSDGPDPLHSDVLLQFYDLKTGRQTNPKLSEVVPLGHQDPAWSPDGKSLLYVRNGREGAAGAPVIYRYDTATKKALPVTGPGYTTPAYSRDGRYMVATKTDSFGTNVVIVDARRGTELLRLTNDGRSWGPVFSPRGYAVVYLHMEDGIVDLRLVHLDGNAPRWTVGKVENLTEAAGLDGASRPGWFIPSSELPALPTTAPNPSAGQAGQPGPSSAAP